MHVLKLRRLAALGLAAAVILSLPGLAAASHSWGGYHWARTANPFTLKVGDNVDLTWDSYLNTTVGEWSQSTVLNLTEVAGGVARPKQCRPTSGRVEVCNAKYGFNGWLGVAQIWASGSHITQGTVKVNDSYFASPTYNTPAWRNMVMCQEVGHTLGLDHQDENFNNPNLGTCMDYTSDPSSNQGPNTGDYDELLCIYDPGYFGVTLTTATHSCTGTGHLDSTTTLSSTPAGGSAAAGGSGFGRLVALSHGGHVATYVRDLGNGLVVVSHVIWA